MFQLAYSSVLKIKIQLVGFILTKSFHADVLLNSIYFIERSRRHQISISFYYIQTYDIFFNKKNRLKISEFIEPYLFNCFST